MKRYWLLAGMIAGFFLAVFLLAQAIAGPSLENPTEWMGRGGRSIAALLGVGLLIVDVLLPVPSAGVMLLHGAWFGVAVGTLLSVVGSVGAALVAFLIGRAGERWVVRFVSPQEHARASDLLARWGALAIVVTRPVPIVAETVMILAGASALGWRLAAVAALAGSLPPAFLFALAGRHAATWGSASLVFLGVLLMSAVVWLLGRGGRGSEGPFHTGGRA